METNNNKKQSTPKQSSKQSTPKQVEPIRKKKGEEFVFHDLFKLKVADFKKNVGIASKPRLENVEHVHFYHTVDSYGRAQEHCSSIGGHTHRMEVYTDEEGNLKAKCGPAIRKFKKYTKEEVAFSDNHTHETMYILSQEVEMRKKTQEALVNLEKARGAGNVQHSSVDNERY